MTVHSSSLDETRAPCPPRWPRSAFFQKQHAPLPQAPTWFLVADTTSGICKALLHCNWSHRHYPRHWLLLLCPKFGSPKYHHETKSDVKTVFIVSKLRPLFPMKKTKKEGREEAAGRGEGEEEGGGRRGGGGE